MLKQKLDLMAVISFVWIELIIDREDGAISSHWTGHALLKSSGGSGLLASYLRYWGRKPATSMACLILAIMGRTPETCQDAPAINPELPGVRR